MDTQAHAYLQVLSEGRTLALPRLTLAFLEKTVLPLYELQKAVVLAAYIAPTKRIPMGVSVTHRSCVHTRAHLFTP